MCLYFGHQILDFHIIRPTSATRPTVKQIRLFSVWKVVGFRPLAQPPSSPVGIRRAASVMTTWHSRWLRESRLPKNGTQRKLAYTLFSITKSVQHKSFSVLYIHFLEKPDCNLYNDSIIIPMLIRSDRRANMYIPS